MTGRLPDAIALYFLESGLIGEVEVDPRRLARARDRIASAAAGMRARLLTAAADVRIPLAGDDSGAPGTAAGRPEGVASRQ